MAFVRVRDIEVLYELRGNGPQLMVISGTGGDLRRKPNAFDMPISDSFELLAYDQRGLGQSSRPDIDYTMQDDADDAAALLDAVGWDSCAVLGISFGGMVGQELAIRHPERVERLVLACTSSGGAGGSSYPLHELQGMPARAYHEALISLMDRRYDEAWQMANPGEYADMIVLAMEGAVGAHEPNRAIGARRQIEARMHHDTYNRLSQLKLPVFICGGRYDGIAASENQVALQQQIANSKMELFEGGHRFYMEDARAFERIIAFLNDTELGN